MPSCSGTAREIHDDLVGKQGLGGKGRSVKNEVRPEGEQSAILRAQGLTFRGIHDHDRLATGILGDGFPLAPGRESSTSAAEQAASGKHVDQPSTASRARLQATLVEFQALVSSCAIGSGQQPANDRRAALGRLKRIEGGARAQFRGPDVTSCPPTAPPAVAAEGGPESLIVNRTSPHTA
jgi:hypothetical protein